MVVTGDVTGDVTGNADTARHWQRTIGTSFDGSRSSTSHSATTVTITDNEVQMKITLLSLLLVVI